VKYFIDTNIIIDLLDNQEEAKEKLKVLVLEEGSELFINRLMVIETLRTIHFNHKKVFREAEEKLKGKCEAIDFLHFITAKYYKLEIVSNDKDLGKLENAYLEYKE